MRGWLVFHVVLGASTVAVTTHLVVWLLRGRRAKWFATVGASLYTAQFLVGNLIYPTYRREVRGAVFDKSAALAGVARLFDVKEHFAAIGLACALGACALAWGWERKRDGDRGRGLLLGLALAAALAAWFAGLAGLWVASYRSIGSA